MANIVGITIVHAGGVAAALQATLYLESLTDKDIPALEAAMDILEGWLGRNMRWAWSSVHAEVGRYRADDLDSLAQTLPIRWAIAGLGLSHWEFDAHESTRSTIYGVARRYPDFDLPFCAGLLGHWRDRPRSVSWRTYLSHELAETALARSGPDTRLVNVTKQKAVVVFQAGEVPEAGDRNSQQYPLAYGAMAQFLGPSPRSLPWHLSQMGIRPASHYSERILSQRYEV